MSGNTTTHPNRCSLVRMYRVCPISCVEMLCANFRVFVGKKYEFFWRLTKKLGGENSALMTLFMLAK